MEKIFGIKDITKISGIMKKMPHLTTGYFFCMLSVIGIPPFLGFSGKLNIIMGALENKMLLVGLLFIISSILTFLYLWRTFKYVFMRGNGNFEIESRFELMSFSVILLGIFSLFSGIIFLFLEGGLFQFLESDFSWQYAWCPIFR